MSNGVSSTGSKAYQNIKTNLTDTKLEGMLNQSKTEQVKSLQQIFTVINDNNVSESEKKALQTRAAGIQENLDKIQKQMDNIKADIGKNQGKIEDAAEDITNLAMSAQNKSTALEDTQRNNVRTIIADVFDEYGRGVIKRDQIDGEISTRLRNSSPNTKEIEDILSQLDSKKGQYQSLIDKATGWIDDINTLKGKYAVYKTSYDLLNKQINQIGNTGTTFKNSDYDTNDPIYSLEKTEIISNLFANTNINVASTNTNYGKESNTQEKTDLATIAQNFQQYLDIPATSGVDSYSGSNATVQKLGEAIDNGLLDALSSSGASKKEVADFLAEHFSGANIRYSSDGQFQIPYGHGGTDVFNKVVDFYNGYQQSAQYNPDTTSKNQGNTIDSNEQLKSLSDNYENIINTLANGNPAFSFKEAMFALFNPDSGLFKNCGITYDPSHATDSNGKPTYSIGQAGDEATAKLYEAIAGKIKEEWNVDIGYPAKQDGGPGLERYDAPQVQRTDPLSFNKDGVEYSFVIDRNNDGKFTNLNEFVGADSNKSWLDDLKSLDTNGDGKLSGDELESLKLLSSDFKDNQSTTKDSAGALRETVTGVNYGMMSASSFGVQEIDLAGLEQRVNQSTGQTDINNSEVFNDGFTMKMKDGSTIEASRKDDTSTYMNAVYKKAVGKSFEIGLDNKTVEDTYNKYSSEFSSSISGLDGLETNLNVLRNADNIAQNARTLFNNSLQNAQDDENTQLQKAYNRSASLRNENGWQNVRQQLEQSGSDIDMEQAKGIYNRNSHNNISASQVQSEYNKLKSAEEQEEQNTKNNAIAWDAMIKCAKNGINASADEIKQLLATGQAKTADDVVNILKSK